jgi:50S ribosomal protein L16 3-hydroxylase
MGIPPLRLLGDVPVARFMREHWQRRPLLVRQALENFVAPVDRARLLDYARSPDAESRLIECTAGRWRVRHGPLARLPARRTPGWTVLVQGLDLLDDGAHRLLQRFRFVPDARLDDLMASYATDGGGVGPHTDSYDVFLLQAFGRRRWRISRQRDLRLVDGAPLRVLSNFRPAAEYVLEPGDLLYLPPGVAHEGTAIGECITYSIGFRAPSYQELLEPMLADFAGRSDLRGRYADPGLEPTRHPGALPDTMVRALHAHLTARRPQPGDVARFLLAFLSEPKAQVVFDRPPRVPSAAAFRAAARQRGLTLDRRTRLLYHRHGVGINGEHVTAAAALPLLRQLADARILAPNAVRRAGADVLDLLRGWYAAGWLHLTTEARPT